MRTHRAAHGCRRQPEASSMRRGVAVFGVVRVENDGGSGEVIERGYRALRPVWWCSGSSGERYL